MASSYYIWLRSHREKKSYPNRRKAWARVLRIWWKDRKPDFALGIYPCTLGNRKDRAGELHYHVGHDRKKNRIRNATKEMSQ